MQGNIVLKFHQLKGKPNIIRLFFNDEMLDEIDTTHETQTVNFDIDINRANINFFTIQVVGTNTVIDDQENILSSNSVIIDDCFININNEVIKCDQNFDFFRKINPVYEIYARQKKINYDRIYIDTKTSTGDGKFLLAFIPIDMIRVTTQPIGEKYLSFDPDPCSIKMDEKFVGWNNGTKIMEKFCCWNNQHKKLTASIEQITERTIYRLKKWQENQPINVYNDQDLLDILKINIQKLLLNYED